MQAELEAKSVWVFSKLGAVVAPVLPTWVPEEALTHWAVWED